MLRLHPLQLAAFVATGLLGVGTVIAQTDAERIAPNNTEANNTEANKADRDGDATTPIDQSNDKDAIETTAAIRRAVMEDKALSTSAHNVKIVTEGNTVTLRGPVASMDEKTRIEQLAVQAAPGKEVRNQISLAR